MNKMDIKGSYEISSLYPFYLKYLSFLIVSTTTLNSHRLLTLPSEKTNSLKSCKTLYNAIQNVYTISNDKTIQPGVSPIMFHTTIQKMKGEEGGILSVL